MPLVNPMEMLNAARDGGYCVGAFNVVDYLTIEAVVEAAVANQAPVIIQTSSATVKRYGVNDLVGMARQVCAKAATPVALHLDHGTKRDIIHEAIAAGYS